MDESFSIVSGEL